MKSPRDLEDHLVSLVITLHTFLPSRMALTIRGWGMDQMSEKAKLDISDVLGSLAPIDAKFFFTLNLNFSLYYFMLISSSSA